MKLEIYIKEIFSFLLRVLLVPTIICKFICKNKGTIIYYHNVNSEIFRKHIIYLVKHYNIISLDCLVSAVIEKNNWKILPKRPLVITMDDGFSGNHNLISILDEFKILVTIFVRPDEINKGNTANQKGRKYLNKREISELLKHNVSFGAHSMTHPYLSKVSDSQARYEIKRSKEYLEKELFINIKHFAYPYGDYSKREMEILKNQSGYVSARTVKPGWIDKKTNLYELKCMGVGDNAGINKMILDVVGIFPYLRIIRSKFFSVRFNKYKTPFTYITGILGLRGPISEHTEQQAELIKKYVKGKKRLVEIGVAEGGSAAVALSVMDPKGTLWLIDPYISTFYPFFSLSLKIAKYSLTKFRDRDMIWLRDYSYNVAKIWNTKVDYLLLDADHSEEGFMRDWNAWSPFVNSNGVVLIQSVRTASGEETGTARVIKRLLKNTDFKWKIIDEADATLVMKRK